MAVRPTAASIPEPRPGPMPPHAAKRLVVTPARLAWGLGALAGLAVVLTLGGPGITTDEPLDVRPGRTYVETLRTRGFQFFQPDVVARVFADNAEHPPLGRWLLGITSTIGQPFEVALLGRDPLGLYLLSGRLAPAACFALLVGLVVHTTARRYGLAAGAGGGVSLLLMPRVFAHAHLGALDTFITTFWILALLAADRALTSRRPVLGMAAAGVAWSLALLTKIHAWFLIPVLATWSLVRLRSPVRAVAAFAVWCATGLCLFVLGWPWLWYDSIPRFRAYLGTGVVRTPIHVLYFGQVYADRDVPWHYPWLHFLATVPVGIHLLGLAGLLVARKREEDQPFVGLLGGSMLLFLVLFSTRVPVYDGERLFLMVFPLWAVLAGRGFGHCWERLGNSRILRGVLVAFLAMQGVGLVRSHPFGLSYYNLLVGGLRGAEALGLELTYWGDAVDRVLLDELTRVVPTDGKAALAPTLYPGQGIIATTRGMASRSLVLGDEQEAPEAGWVVVSRRTAYWSKDLQTRLERSQPVFERSREGVWLSRIYAAPP